MAQTERETAREQATQEQTAGRRTPGALCPYCGGALREGFVRSRDPLRWNGGRGGFADLDFQGWFMPKARAWLCPACGIVLLRTRD